MVFLFFIGCGEGMDENKIKSEMNSAEQELETTSGKIDNKIDDLQSKLDTAGAEFSEDIKDDIDHLQTLKIKTDKKKDELSEATADRWDEFKGGFNEFMDDVESDLDKIADSSTEVEKDMTN